MSNKVRPQYADQKGEIVEGFDRNAIICEGPTVPTDGTAGFAPGCLWYKRGGAAGAQLYINEGSITSCDFNPMTGGPTNGPRVVAGTVALDGSNPTPVVTGLTTIVAAVATLTDTDGVGTGTAFVTVSTSGGTLNIYGWVAAGTASTGTETVNYIAFGT